MTAANERNTLVWDSVSQVPRIGEIFDRRGVTATWFVRADNQLHEVYGHPAWLLRENASLWTDLRRAGHSIGWHPHVVRHDEGGFFTAEIDDKRCAAALRVIHAALSADGFDFRACRIGEAFHGNESMRALDDLGLAVDSTALPGRRRDDAARCFDWSVTPNRPYRPSAADYRIPGARSLSIVEVPMTTVPVKAPYDDRPLPRYLNLAYHDTVFRAAVRSHFQSLRQSGHVLVTIVHPEETRGETQHPLYAHDLQTVERNLGFLLSAASDYGEVELATLEQAARYVDAEVVQ